MTAEERWTATPAEVVRAMDSLSASVSRHPSGRGYRLSVTRAGVTSALPRRYRTFIGVRLAMVRVLSGGQP